MPETIRTVCVLLALLVTISAEEIEDEEPCDFIIVGAGTTTLALAGLLADVPFWRVCVFDRGPEETGMSEWYTNNYKFTSPHDPFWLTEATLQTNVGSASNPYNKNKDGRNIYIPRFRGRGGTSRVYGAIARRASPDVLDLWPEGWDHESMNNYYKKLEDHYCFHDSEEVTGISHEECKTWHGNGGAMQLNSQMKEAFQKFPREMEYLCKDKSKPWKGYANDYNGPLADRESCSVFQQYKLRLESTESGTYPTETARKNRASKTGRGSSYTGYYQYKDSKPELMTSAPVTKIIFEGTKAIGVTYLDIKTNTIRIRKATKEVIIGAGSFETPHLLQLSGVGPKSLLDDLGIAIVAVNEHVGKNLWDHISVPYVLKLAAESNDFCCDIDGSGIPKVEIDGKIYETRDLDRINGPFSWIIHYRSSNTRTPQNMSDVQLYVMGNSKLFDEVGPLCTSDYQGNDLPEYNFDGQSYQNEDEETNEGTIRIIDQWPEYRGFVKALTRNIFDMPMVDYGWLYSLNDVKSKEFKAVSKLFREQIKLLREMFFGDDVHPELSKLILGEVAPGLDIDTDDELDAWLRGMFVSALHPVGTCKMPECADEFLQVKGVSNLRVCDASAFATQTDGNPAATLYAMAEKLGDMLKFQYLKQINIAVRKEIPISADNQDMQVDAEAGELLIKSLTDCFDGKMEFEWLPTGKDTSAIIVKWSLICHENVNEQHIADQVIMSTLGPFGIYGCSAKDYPLFNRDVAKPPKTKASPQHKSSSYIFVAWCQHFKNTSPGELWQKVGNWKGNSGTNPGSEHCFKLNCQPEMCSVLRRYDNEKREYIYNEPNIDLAVSSYISTKKVVERKSGLSSSYMRTGSMISDPGEDWYKLASYILENVYLSSGTRLARQYPPLNQQNGWWTERSDGLLYYETKGFISNEKVASFDLDGTLIKTKSGGTFPEDEDDWQFFSSGVVPKLQQNQANKINNVIMSNQKGISTGSQDKREWMTKIEAVTKEIGVPMFVLAATKNDKYRKPETGMWDFYQCTLNQFKTIDKSSAVYVGDAAGDDGDFSDSDKKFAENIDIKFSTPETYFPVPLKSEL